VLTAEIAPEDSDHRSDSGATAQLPPRIHDEGRSDGGTERESERARERESERAREKERKGEGEGEGEGEAASGRAGHGFRLDSR
jgi:hypothetical protein